MNHNLHSQQTQSLVGCKFWSILRTEHVHRTCLQNKLISFKFPRTFTESYLTKNHSETFRGFHGMIEKLKALLKASLFRSILWKVGKIRKLKRIFWIFPTYAWAKLLHNSPLPPPIYHHLKSPVHHKPKQQVATTKFYVISIALKWY